MARYKTSLYNFFVPHENNNFLAYNSRTNALGLLEGEKYSRFMQHSETLDELDPALLADLLYGGYILPAEVDEKELIRFNIFKGKFDSSYMGLTIAPTLQCNFRCPYCYEAGVEKPGKMSGEVQKQFLEWLERRLRHIRHLQLTWYGGEPLLALDVITELGEQIMDLTKRYHVQMSSSMITNGYLLTSEVMTKLESLEVQRLQVTLDGPPEVHDQRRYLSNGAPTFAKILDNLKRVAGHKIAIGIRANVDYENLHQCEQMIDLLTQEGLQDKVGLYFACVESHNGINPGDSCMSVEAFSLHNMRLRNRLVELNYKTHYGYPRLKGSYCIADNINGFVVDPAGYLYKCWTDIGFTERAIGKVGPEPTISERYQYDSNQLRYMRFDPTTDPTCGECKILPLCVGSCPARRLFKSEKTCDETRYNIEEILKGVVKYEIYKTLNPE